ncbi:MAG TPA: EcsC family protein [Micropepsaceae bacterium]|nr:EcsC family protein [Micropepsaceae bacterium]
MTDERGRLFAKLVQMLDWAYDKTQSGYFGWASAEVLAQDYLGKFSNPDDAIDSLIRWQTGSAGMAGFVTGVGGLWFLPIGLPANLASVLYIQLRMVSAIALIRGYSLQSDQVRSLAYASLCGTRAADLLKDVGIRFAASAIHHIGRETITSKVGSRVFTRMGRTGLVNVGKMMPLIGGLVGGGIDASMTKIIGITAKRVFVQRDYRGAEGDCYQVLAIEVVRTTA